MVIGFIFTDTVLVLKYINCIFHRVVRSKVIHKEKKDVSKI